MGPSDVASAARGRQRPTRGRRAGGSTRCSCSKRCHRQFITRREAGARNPMSKKCVINVDLADVWSETGRKKFLRTLAWGDEVAVIKQSSTRIEIETVVF